MEMAPNKLSQPAAYAPFAKRRFVRTFPNATENGRRHFSFWGPPVPVHADSAMSAMPTGQPLLTPKNLPL